MPALRHDREDTTESRQAIGSQVSSWLSTYFCGVISLATGADGIDDGEKFSCDMTNGYAVMFVHLMFMTIQSSAQGDAAAFTHFDFAAPLATFAHPGIHAGIGQQQQQQQQLF